jgi:type II secretory pathway component PulM
MKLKMTLLAVGLLVVGAVAVPAMAQPDHASDRRDAAQEKRSDKFAEFKQQCAEAGDNASKRCEQIRDAEQPFKQARREANALSHAVDAMYKRVGKLEMKEFEIEQSMESGNLTDNQTAEAQDKLDRIDAAQEKALLKIQEMEAKLERLKAKWAEVRDHVDEMRAKRGDGHTDADDEDSDSDETEESEDDLSDKDES